MLKDKLLSYKKEVYVKGQTVVIGKGREQIVVIRKEVTKAVVIKRESKQAVVTRKGVNKLS